MSNQQIEIDDETLRLLRRGRSEDESINDTIKRLARRPAHLEAWFKEIDQLGPPSAEFVAHFREGDDDSRFTTDDESR